MITRLVLDKLPCASLLIRIREAPKEGFKFVRKEDYPQKDWDKLGIWPYAKPYTSGTYCNAECRVGESELKLFDSLAKDKNRAEKVERPVADEAIQFAIKVGKMPGDEVPVEEVEEYLYNLIGDYLVPSTKIRIIDLKYFAIYSEEAGFKVAIDGMHNLRNEEVFVTLFGLNPPGILYSSDDGKKDTTQIMLNSSLDWNSPLSSPAYIEGYVHYRKVPASKNLHMVIDVRQVRKKKEIYYEQTPYAWTILPLFTYDNYVNSGIYQLPLFKGPVQPDILKELKAANDPWEKLMQITRERDPDTRKPRLVFLNSSSMMVRLVDGQREGHFSVPFDWSRISYKYLPQDQLYEYAYNEAVMERLRSNKRLSKIKPDGLTDLEYNLKITKSVVNVFELLQFSEQQL